MLRRAVVACVLPPTACGQAGETASGNASSSSSFVPRTTSFLPRTDAEPATIFERLTVVEADVEHRTTERRRHWNDACDDGAKIGKKCLFRLHGEFTYAEAVRACLKEGAGMATIHSDRENSAVIGLVQHGLDRKAYLGGTRSCRSARDCDPWSWDDGSEWWQPEDGGHDGLDSNGGTYKKGETHIIMTETGMWQDWGRGEKHEDVICQVVPPPPTHRKELGPNYVMCGVGHDEPCPPKNKVLYALLYVFVVGFCGADRCFLGNVGMGFAKLFSCGGCLVWAIIDFCFFIYVCWSRATAIHALGFVANFTLDSIEPAFWTSCLTIIPVSCVCIGQIHRRRKRKEYEQFNKTTSIAHLQSAPQVHLDSVRKLHSLPFQSTRSMQRNTVQSAEQWNAVQSDRGTVLTSAKGTGLTSAPGSAPGSARPSRISRLSAQEMELTKAPPDPRRNSQGTESVSSIKAHG